MLPIAKVIMLDKQAEATANKLFEDLYNRVSSNASLNAALREGKLLRPHIDATQTGTEFSYAWIYAHAFPVKNAELYAWAIRRQGTTNWTTFFSVDNEVKIIFLYFNVTYEIRVIAIGAFLIKSPWSFIVPVLTPPAPKPSKVTGVTITDEALYVDPTTGITLASVKVEWNNNPLDELVDSYEELWND